MFNKILKTKKIGVMNFLFYFFLGLPYWGGVLIRPSSILGKVKRLNSLALLENAQFEKYFMYSVVSTRVLIRWWLLRFRCCSDTWLPSSIHNLVNINLDSCYNLTRISLEFHKIVSLVSFMFFRICWSKVFVW